MPPLTYTFVYQCHGCGTVEVVTKQDAEEHAAGMSKGRLAADTTLTEHFGWTDPTHCGNCDPVEYSPAEDREPQRQTASKPPS